MWEENNEAEDPEKYDADLAGDIMTVILYNQNLGILEKEVQQEAAYLSSGVDVAGEEYLKKLEPMIKADEDTRLTFISQSGDVLYDSDSSKKLENHNWRKDRGRISVCRIR